MRRSIAVAVAVSVLAAPAVALAAWSATASGSSFSKAVTMPTGNASSASASGATVSLTWTASKFADGSSVGGYIVKRYESTGTTSQTINPSSSCAGIVTGTSCTETSVPSGTWKYSITPKHGNWLGAESSTTSVTVGPSDTTAPRLTSLEMFDVNNNGKVDRVIATFDDDLEPSTNTGQWTLRNVPSNGTLASVSTSSNKATLTLNEGGFPDTAVGSFTVALSASATGIRDSAGNQSSFSATAPADKAAPVMAFSTWLEMQDNDHNGKIDRVVAAFTENIVSSTATAPWTLSNVPSGGTLASVATGDSNANGFAILNLTQGPGAPNTAVGSFTVALSASPSGIRDAAGNQSSFSATAPTDKAGPVPAAVTTTNAGDSNQTGLMQAGDTLSVTFSEPLKASTVGATTSISEADPAGSGGDTLSLTGFSSGPLLTSHDGYIAADGTTATFASSVLTLSGDAKTVTATVAGTCTGTCGANITRGGPAPLIFAPASTLTDAAGNGARGHFATGNIRIF